MTEVNNINLPIKKLECKMLCNLIIDVKIPAGERVFLAIEKLWQGEYVLWAKYKHKDEVSTYISHLPTWLVKLCGLEVLSKFDLSMQELALSTE